MIANRDFMAAKPAVVSQFVKVTQRAYAECARTPQPCIDALVEGASGLNAADQMVNWQLDHGADERPGVAQRRPRLVRPEADGE